AAVAFTSTPITVRYLTVQWICYPPKSGQLTEGGLSPPKIGSLVGCSPNAELTVCLRRSLAQRCCANATTLYR
ncbi:MAG: hypothetical protein ACK54C_06170, partial [Betaproteobacteria bacterium]